MRLSGSRLKWRFLWGALFFLIVIFYFSVGEKIKPYAELLFHIDSGDKASGSEVVDQLAHMLRNSFVDPLYGEELLYPAMSSLVEIDVAMAKNFVRAERIENSYNDISIRAWFLLRLQGEM